MGNNRGGIDLSTITILFAFHILVPKAITLYGKMIDKCARYFDIGGDDFNNKVLIPKSFKQINQVSKFSEDSIDFPTLVTNEISINNLND